MQRASYQSYAIISVAQPILQQGTSENVPSYVTYLVAGQDPHGIFHIRRRFREFLLLRNKLVERFIGIYIPPIPSKKAAGNTEERYVEERRQFLNYFCLKVATKPFLFDSDIFQTFIRGDPDFQRAARLISSHQYALIANIYELQYKAASQELDIPKISIQIEAEASNLRIVQKKLIAIRDQIQEVADAKRQFIAQYSEIYRTVLPRFEQEILMAHGPQNNQILFSRNEIFKEKLSDYLHYSEANPLLGYVQSLNYDIREARALLQAIESRRAFENKKSNFQSARRSSKEELERLKSGRVSFKSFFTSGTKEVQIKDLENFIPQYERNEAFVSMCLPLSATSIHKELKEFKKSRAIDYLATLQIIAQKEMRMLSLYGSMLISAQSKHVPKSFLVSTQIVSSGNGGKESEEDAKQ